MNRAHRTRERYTFLISVATLTPLVISKKPNIRVRSVVGREKLYSNDDIQPTSDEKKTTYAHTVSIDMEDDATADVKTETESLHGAII